jgi:hypothetical protein
MKSIISASLILAGLFLPWSDAFGQSKFALSVTAAPFFGHTKSRIEAMLPDPNGSGTPTLQVLRSESSPKGYWIGLGGRYSFSQRWSASTGLWFRNSVLKMSTGNSRSHQFSIPLMANFQPSERKLSPYFSAGALWNFGTTSRMKIPDVGTVVFKSDRNTGRISPTVGAGVIYHFAQRLSLIAQPTFSYAIPPSGFDMKAYQMGLHVQLMFKL